MSQGDWPEESELVVCTVDSVKDFVAFVSLDEYAGRQGLIPISEIATGWIKYIRDHIREGQKIVCKVLNVDEKRGHIDLSLKDVNEHQRREKIREWKNESKSEKWIGFAAESAGVPADTIISALQKEFGSLYTAFEAIATEGRECLEKTGLDESVQEALVHVASGNVKIPKVTVTAILELTSNKPDGVNIIRRALRSAEPKVDNAEIELLYIGAPNYRIKVTAPDYKTAEKTLEKAAHAAIGVMERSGDLGKLIKKPKSGKAV